MSSLAEQYERIERYLQGVMSPGELDDFNQELNADTELASAVKLHGELAETLAGEKIHEFRQTLKTVDAGWKPSAGGRWLSVWRNPQKLAIAAGVLLLVGFFGWLALQPTSNPKLSAQYYEQLPLQALMSAESGEEQALRSEAHQAYIDELYPQAAEKFTELVQRFPDNVSYQLYLGISQLGGENPEPAVRTLQPLAESQNQTVRLEAAWYLALAYLALDDPNNAKPYLEKLVEAGAYRVELAEQVLQDID